MNVLLQRHCAKHIYTVPDGLRELMSDISREVLRHQPENIYNFVADYLDALLITRENARVAARLVQTIAEISQTVCELLTNAGMDLDEANRLATSLQKSLSSKFEQPQAIDMLEKKSDDVEEAQFVSEILEDAEISREKSEQAALVIQKAFRTFKERRNREKELLSGMIDWRIAARCTIRLYKQTGVSDEEAKRAATLISAAYKGYYTRKIMKKLASERARIWSQDKYEDQDEQEDEYYGEPVGYEQEFEYSTPSYQSAEEYHSDIGVGMASQSVAQHALSEIIKAVFDAKKEVRERDNAYSEAEEVEFMGE